MSFLQLVLTLDKTGIGVNSIFRERVNLTDIATKMTQISIEIDGNFHFSQIWHGQTFKTSTQCYRC